MSNLRLQRAKSKLSHHAPYCGTGLRRLQSDNGEWLDAALERGRQIVEILAQHRTNEEGYSAVFDAVGIRPRQARNYVKLWSLRFVLESIWAETEPEDLPRTIEQAIDAARELGRLTIYGAHQHG